MSTTTTETVNQIQTKPVEVAATVAYTSEQCGNAVASASLLAARGSLVLPSFPKLPQNWGLVPLLLPPPNNNNNNKEETKEKEALVLPSKRSTNTSIRLNKFVRRLHDMLVQETQAVEWRSGLLILHDTASFTKNILPKYFNTRNFKTFRRQLNYYGFCHVRSISNANNSTTALWVNQDLANDEADLSAVLTLKRVEPNESAKTAAGRRARKERAISTVNLTRMEVVVSGNRSSSTTTTTRPTTTMRKEKEHAVVSTTTATTTTAMTVAAQSGQQPPTSSAKATTTANMSSSISAANLLLLLSKA